MEAPFGCQSIAACCFACGLAACGDAGPDLAGVYEVTLDTDAQPSCEQDPVILESPLKYLVFYRTEADGISGFDYDRCAVPSNAPMEPCERPNLHLANTTLSEPIENGWQFTAASVMASLSDCTMSYRRRTAVRAGTQLRVVDLTYAAQFQWSDPCTPEEARLRGETMPCTRKHVIEATLLE